MENPDYQKMLQEERQYLQQYLADPEGFHSKGIQLEDITSRIESLSVIVEQKGIDNILVGVPGPSGISGEDGPLD